jgi:hypothetical protein
MVDACQNSPPTSPESEEAEADANVDRFFACGDASGAEAPEQGSVATLQAASKAQKTKASEGRGVSLADVANARALSARVVRGPGSAKSLRFEAEINGQTREYALPLPDVSDPDWKPNRHERMMFGILLQLAERFPHAPSTALGPPRLPHSLTKYEALNMLKNFTISIEDDCRTPDGMLFVPHQQTEETTNDNPAYSLCGLFPHLVTSTFADVDSRPPNSDSYWVFAERATTLVCRLRQSATASTSTRPGADVPCSEQALLDLIAVADGRGTQSHDSDPRLRFEIKLALYPNARGAARTFDLGPWRKPPVGPALQPVSGSGLDEGESLTVGMRGDEVMASFFTNKDISSWNFADKHNRSGATFVFVVQCTHPLLQHLSAESIRFHLKAQTRIKGTAHFVLGKDGAVALLPLERAKRPGWLKRNYTYERKGKRKTPGD